MSKSMAIEGVMKIFLMIAVIIVGMSFLLKAFGIDILGWLQDKLGGIDIPSAGKALHVALDETGPELWEFHLVKEEPASKYRFGMGSFFSFAVDDNNLVHPANVDSEKEAFFMLGDMPSDKCILLITNEQNGQGVTDLGSVYFINPGTKIEEGCGDNLHECILSSLLNVNNFLGCRTTVLNRDRLVDGSSYKKETCLFVNSCERGNPGKFCTNRDTDDDIDGCKNKDITYKIGTYYVPDLVNPSPSKFHHKCAMGDDDRFVAELESDKTILGVEFTPVISNKGKCKGVACNLLKLNPDKSHSYIVKYGLICDTSSKQALWKVCKQSDKPITATANNINFKCDFNGERGVWGPG